MGACGVWDEWVKAYSQASLSGYEALAALGRTEVVGNSNKPSRAGSRAATPKDEVPGSPKSPKSDTSASAKDEKS